MYMYSVHVYTSRKNENESIVQEETQTHTSQRQSNTYTARTQTNTHKGTTTTLTKSHTRHHIHNTHNNIYVCIGTVTAHTVTRTSNTLTCNYTPRG